MYHLQVYTPEEIMFDDDVVALIAPGSQGYFGVLSGHAPLIATLKSGIFVITSTHKQKYYYFVLGGFLEVKDNKAIVLADSMQPTAAVDINSPI